MSKIYSTTRRIWTALIVLLIFKVTASVVLNYTNYLPPNFNSDFLRGRDEYFWAGYHQAFYAHIATGPVSLVLGTILISEKFRRRFPKWHRYLGRIQGMCVLLVVVPSGLWMAFYAAAGPVATVGFVILAVLTGLTVALGWRAAVNRRFADHRRWMWRCYLLLCSAVVLRLIGGLGTVLEVGAPWFDPLAGWLSWVLPLAAFEVNEFMHRKSKQPVVRPMPALEGR